jgi:hypothetical protein
MRTYLQSGSRDRDVLRPTVWGYATARTTSCLLGEVPGLPPHLVRRTDVVVPGLTPLELEHVQRYAQWRATTRPRPHGVVGARVAGVAVLVVTAVLAGRPMPLVALAASVGVLLSVHGTVCLLGPRISRTERRALRRAIEVRRVRNAPPTSIGLHVLVAMSAVEGAGDALDASGRALARELLWSAFDAVRRGDDDGVRHTTSAMIHLAVRAARTARDGVPGEPLS